MKENNKIEDVIGKFHISNNLGLGTSYALGYGSSKRKISLEDILVTQHFIPSRKFQIKVT